MLELTCFLTVVGALVAFGALLGSVFTRARNRTRPPAPDWRSDLAAASRSIQRLAEEKTIDQELSAQLLELFRNEIRRREQLGHDQAAAKPPAEEPAEANRQLPTNLSDDSPPAEEPAVVAEIVAEPAKPPLATPRAGGASASSPPETLSDGHALASASSSPHPLDRPEPPAPAGPSPAQQRRRAIADVLQAFMEEKNIRWGEIVSGMLIVGCSIALAISLRREIETLSERFIYLPALLFMLATAAIHGAGNYTLRRWNLRATSRGVLIIATLLIPINFLAAIIVSGPESRQLPAFHPLYLAAVAVGALAFGTMAYFAAQALLREGRWRLWVAVMGTSAGQLLISRLTDHPPVRSALWGLVFIPLAAFLAATIGQLATVNRQRIGQRAAGETFLVLGIASFAFAAPVGLLLSKVESYRDALAWLSVPLSLPSVVVLAIGLAIQNRARSRRFAAIRTAGTWLAVMGGLLLLAAVLLAWPEPVLLIAIGAASFLALSFLAAVSKMPVLHLPAIACGALAALVAFHYFQDAFAGYEQALSRRVFSLYFMGRSSLALTLLAVLVAGAGVLLTKRDHAASGTIYLVGSAGIALLGMISALAVGFLGAPSREPELASLVLLFFAVALLAAGHGAPRAAATWSGTTLLLIALVQSLGFNPVVHDLLEAVRAAPRRPVLTATLLHGLVAVTLAAAITFWARRRASHFADRWRQQILPLVSAGLVSSGLALPSAVFVDEMRFAAHTGYVAALALIWLVGAVVLAKSAVVAVFQALASLVLIFATTATCQRTAWWDGSLLRPQHLQAQFCLLAVWCLAWSTTRLTTRRRWPRFAVLLRCHSIAVDELILIAAIVSLVVWSASRCWAGAANELGLAAADHSLRSWQTTFGLGAWLATVLLLAANCSALLDRFNPTKFAGLFLAAAVVPVLVAAQFYESAAVASALRWSFAFYGVLLTAVICFGRRISAVARDRLPFAGRWPSNAAEMAAAWSLGISAPPILGLTTANLAQAISGNALGGPAPGSLFDRIGSEISFGLPLGVLTAILVVHALRQRNEVLMLASSAVFQYLVNLAYFLPIIQDPAPLTGWPLAIGCLQWNALGLTSYTLAWHALRGWLRSRSRQPVPWQSMRCFTVQVCLAIISVLALTGLAAAVVVWSPGDLTPYLAFRSWHSYAAALIGFLAVWWSMRPRSELVAVSLWLGTAASAGGILAISLAGPPGSWHGFHALIVVWGAVAALAAALTWGRPTARPGGLWSPHQSRAAVQAAVSWAAVFCSLGVLLAIRAADDDPQSPWWSFGVAANSAIAAGVVGLRLRSQLFAYWSTGIAAIAITIVWWGAWPKNQLQTAVELLQLNLIAVALAGIVWCFVELRYQRRRRRRFDRKTRLPALHRTVIVAAGSLMLLVTATGFALTGLAGVQRREIDVANPCGWVLVVLMTALAAASLWDRRARLGLVSLYGCGMATWLLVLDEVDQRLGWENDTVLIAAGLLLAAYVAASGHAWRFGANLAALAERAGIPDPVAQLKGASRWLPQVSLLISAAIVAAGFWVVLAFPERWMRVCAAFTPLMLAYGVSCHAQQSRRVRLQDVTLTLLGVFAVFASWADIQPGLQATLVLERAVRLLVALATVAFLFAIPVSRWTKVRESDWLPRVRAFAVSCGLAALLALVGVLVLEVSYFEPGIGVPFGHPYQIVAVALTLLALVIAFLAMALSEQRDPFALSLRGRMAYVYIAQLIALFLFAHLYLSNPQLFGAWEPYWPYIVMAIAFTGVGVGEVFQRSSLPVLAEPFRVTGGLLPLLPALTWWANQSLGIEAAGHYSLLLFFVGLLYAALAMLRRSFISALAAALAGNAALWALLADYEALALLKHPQFWLIPPAVSMLAATHINRRHLSETQLTGIRYVCLLVIYVSSTADIFIEGVGDSLWEPMALAALSVAGVFVGVGLRIRAFLYLGATFVFMSVVSMVWHAYANVQHVAIWWAFGIVLGLLILTVFGVFEKKRAELLRIVEAMREWEA